MSRPETPSGANNLVDKKTVLILASMAQFLGSVMGSSLSIALPAIGVEFSADAISLSWIPTSYLLAAAVALVPSGRIADISGRKRVFLIGVLGWTVVSILCALASSTTLLIIFRALQGVAGAMVAVTAMAIITSVYEPQERGRALGISVAAVYAGLSLGPSVGGVMTEQLGWRSMFFLNAAMGGVILALTLWKLKAEWAEAHGEKLDLVGSAIFGVMLISIMYGFSVLPTALGYWLILAGIASLIAFVEYEGRVANPALNIALFRDNAAFAMSNLAALINYASTSAITFLVSIYLQYVRGLDPQTAGFVLLAQPIMMFLLSPIAGRLSDRIEPRVVASAGMSFTALGLALLSFVNDGSSMEYIVAALVVAGFGFGLFSSPNSNAIMSSVERRDMGIASATVSVMRSVGQMLSMGIATLIIAVYVGGVQITPQYHASFSNGFRLTFAIFAVMCLIGVFSSLARGKIHGGSPENPVRSTTASGGL